MNTLKNKGRPQMTTLPDKLKILICFLLLVSMYPTVSLASTDEEKMKAVEEMFSSPYTEEMYYRTDRLLLTATKREMSLRKAPAIATVITAKEVKDMGARNLMDVLKMVPGIGVSINEQGVKMFEVRGIRTTLSEKILFMINGHTLNKNYVGSALSYVFDDLTVEYIKQIEIVRGPGSALYGANAFVAVINVITKDLNDIDGIQMTASTGSFDTRKINLLGGKEIKDFEIFGSIDFWKTSGPNLVIERDLLTSTSITTTPGNAELENEKTDIFFNLRYGDLDFTGQYIRKIRDDYIGFSYALTDDSSWKIDNYWCELQYNLQIGGQFSSNVKLYLDKFEQDSSLELLPEGYGGSFPNGMIGGPKTQNRTTGGEIQLDYDFFDNNHLILGLFYEKLKQYDVKSISNYNPNTYAYLGSVQDISSWGNWNKDAKRESWGNYLQDEWEITKELNLTAGLRYDHYSDFGDTVNPRIGLVWNFLKRADLKLLYGEAFRAPNFVELFNTNNPVIVGNEDLNPEEIKTYEASLVFQPTDFISTNLSYFYSNIKELIVWDTSVSPAQYINKGGAKIDGIELMVEGNYDNINNYWKLTYTYQDPKDKDTNGKLPYVPYQRASVSVGYEINRYLNSHADVLWTGARSRAAGDTRDEMDSYTTVDLAFTAKNFYKNLEIIGVIHNLFDKNYRDPDTSGSSQSIPDDFPREGIAATLNVTYSF